MLPKVCAWITVITFTKIYWILPMHSNVTIKNVSWPHFSWPTLYINDMLQPVYGLDRQTILRSAFKGDLVVPRTTCVQSRRFAALEWTSIRYQESINTDYFQKTPQDIPILQTLWHYPRTITTPLCFRCVFTILNSQMFLLRILYSFIT